MSMYFGGAVDNTPILHITAGTDTVHDMQSALPLSTTVFHSNMEYISFTMYECTFSIGIPADPDAPYNALRRAVLDRGIGAYINLPAACLSSIINDHKAFIIESVVGTPTLNLAIQENVTAGNCRFYNSSKTAFSKTSLSSSYPIPFIKGSAITRVRVYVLNIDRAGYMPPVLPSSGISIGGGDIVVNGISLLNFGYLSTAVLNNTDSAPTVGNSQVQFINSDSVGNSIGIVKDGVDYKISKGTNDIFNSALGLRKVFYKSNTIVSIPSANVYVNATPQDYLIGSTISVGDVFLVNNVYASSDFVDVPMHVFTYVEGAATTVFHFTFPYGGFEGFIQIYCSGGNVYYRRYSTGPSGYFVAWSSSTHLIALQ